MPISRRIAKQNVVCSYSGILFRFKKEGNAMTWMNVEDIMLNEISPSQKDMLDDSTYVRYLKESNL